MNRTSTSSAVKFTCQTNEASQNPSLHRSSSQLPKAKLARVRCEDLELPFVAVVLAALLCAWEDRWKGLGFRVPGE